jgi:hypothetical protein
MKIKTKWLVAFFMVTLVLSPVAALAVDVLLQGDFLQVGVNESGGLIDNSISFKGIRFDPTGTGAYTPADFLTPGTPFEGYLFSINGGTPVAGGFSQGNPAAFSTTDKSVPPLHATLSTSIGGVIINQLTYFDTTSSSIHFSLDVLNTTSSTITFAYARGIDPDQDANQFDSFETVNTIGTGKVTAFGPLTQFAISIIDLTGDGVPSIVGSWPTDNLAALVVGTGGALSGLYEDDAIYMAWNYTIAANVSKEIDWEYKIERVPEPSILLLLGAGLIGLAGVRRFFKE